MSKSTLKRTLWVCATSILFLAAESTTALKRSLLDSVVPPFMRSLSDYQYMQYDRCLRVKIQEDNDDDGNSYFYNGAYRSQSQLYLAYRLCNSCGCQDGGTSFLVAFEDVLEDHIQYTQDYCNSCSNMCQRRRRAEGEDDEEEGEEEQGGEEGAAYNVNCNTCVNQCAPMLSNYYEGEDETEYLGCQAAYEDDGGVQYYSGPACSSDGELTIGLFYDEDCSFKSNNQDGYGSNFGMNTFLSYESLCLNCEDGVCDDVEANGLNCVDGRNQNGDVDDELNACKAFKKVTKEWKYASPKKNYHIPLIVAFLSVVVAFLCGSYTYFVNHKRAKAEKALLESNEGATPDQPTKAEYAEMT